MAQPSEITELIQLVQGYKVFMGILGAAFSFILLLLLYIWNGMLKNLNKALENQKGIQRIVDRHDVEIEHLKKE